MNDRDWLILSTLFQLKTISKTATKLYVSQPALTSRLKHMEEFFGVPLLSRSNRGVIFTPAGEAAAHFAEQHLKDIAILKEKVTATEQKLIGTIRLGAPRIMNRYYIPSMLEGFQKMHPGIKFRLTSLPSEEVTKLLNSNQIDFAFTKQPKQSTENKRLKLLSTHVYIVNRMSFTLDSLPEMDLIYYPLEGCDHHVFTAWWNDHYNVPPKISMFVPDLDIAKDMVQKGLGYSYFPEMMFHDTHSAPLHKTLVLHKNQTPLVRTTWLLCKKSALYLPLHKIFYEYIANTDFTSFLHVPQ